ncbi:MAG TPA: hypothetical protein VM120_27195 [Bryobacteraceae bacterium]|nr:hypothetical protein [Bryobacteraceae bacterium]
MASKRPAPRTKPKAKKATGKTRAASKQSVPRAASTLNTYSFISLIKIPLNEVGEMASALKTALDQLQSNKAEQAGLKPLYGLQTILDATFDKGMQEWKEKSRAKTGMRK